MQIWPRPLTRGPVTYLPLQCDNVLAAIVLKLDRESGKKKNQDNPVQAKQNSWFSLGEQLTVLILIDFIYQLEKQLLDERAVCEASL